MEVFELGVSALAENGLRPGADLSLARAELIASVPNPPNQPNDDESQDVISHPMVARQQAELDAARARKDVAAKSSLPKFDLLASAYFRGTGALLDGTFESGSDGSGGSAGLWPKKSNWALGVAVRFPFLEIPRFEQEKTLLDFKAKAAAARYDKAVQHLTAELARAHIRVDATRRIAENTPVELEAARALQVQAPARYEAGLADVLEVATSERILRRAETEDAVARLDVWRARFELAVAEGDLTPVLSQLE